MPRLYRRPYVPKIDVPAEIDSRSIRRQLGVTQSRFARMLGVSIRIVEGWERLYWCKARPGEDTSGSGGGLWIHRQRRPTGAARVLLAMVARDPWVVFDCLSGQLKPRGQQKARLWD